MRAELQYVTERGDIYEKWDFSSTLERFLSRDIRATSRRHGSRRLQTPNHNGRFFGLHQCDGQEANAAVVHLLLRRVIELELPRAIEAGLDSPVSPYPFHAVA